MPIHNEWLLSCVDRYAFDDVDEVLRHLIYTANSESKPNKKLIFKTVRCLHCHVGARADQHKKVNLGTIKDKGVTTSANEAAAETSGKKSDNTTIAIHTFHYEWLARVTKVCKIASVEKCVRIIIDYYQSRVKQVYHSDGPKAAAAKELLIFGKNRHDDPRYASVLQNDKENPFKARNEPCGGSEASASNSSSVLSDDPAACSEGEMADAIQRCQVGRNSHSYAVAMKETPAETQARRAKEILVEESDETKRARAQIRKALGSPMG